MAPQWRDEALAGTIPPVSTTPSFKGNKSALAQKPCAVCGRPMSWRKAWARNWDAVRYCSEACRRLKPRAVAKIG